ncbi:MAG TPA: glycosyltransferase [Gaiellaceae bacterium]|nr:glycosyltransferase [Gaiellaceae bacterium]
MDPLVSIVVPVYNAEEFLAAAIESLRTQTYPSCEVIVVDDGSTDRSEEIAGSFPAVLTLRQPNAGAAAARNAGIERASGQFIAFHDADDLVPPTKLAVQVGYLLEHPDVDCVLGRQEWIDPPPWLARDAVYGELGGIPLPSAVYRAAVLRELGGFNEAFRTGEDVDLLIRLRERGGRYVILPDVVLHRRFHGENLSVVAGPPKNRIRSLKAKLDRERARGGAEERQ